MKFIKGLVSACVITLVIVAIVLCGVSMAGGR